ncbi:MAG: zinc ribbon domain-containing protein [Clostridia bacterium]|nr:zinc ribbon domain-containing protein [Clostridia bacterium]
MSTFWDDLKGKLFQAKDEAGKIAKIALDKTTNAVDITKLNFAKSEAESKVNKLYAKIGEVIYQQYKNGEEFDGAIGEDLIEIDRFKEEAEDLKAQIAALKSTAPCPECGQQNDKSSEYCSKCGAKLTEDVEDEDAEEDVTVDVTSEE